MGVDIFFQLAVHTDPPFRLRMLVQLLVRSLITLENRWLMISLFSQGLTCHRSAVPAFNRRNSPTSMRKTLFRVSSPFVSGVIWDNDLSSPGPQLPHLQNGNKKSTYHLAWSWGLHDRDHEPRVSRHLSMLGTDFFFFFLRKTESREGQGEKKRENLK